MNRHHPIMAGVMLAAFLIQSTVAAHAQVPEEEPNDACIAAQPIGPLAGLPASVLGSLDANRSVEPPVYDVDFYAFEAQPGTRLRAELLGASSAQGTLGDPFLGFFDTDCSLITANDDSALGLDSRLDFQVPENGLFILAATGCCDVEFFGAHAQEGSYVLSILEVPPAIGSISGRLVDALSGEPLSGFDPPYAFIELFRCENAGCFEYVAFAVPDTDGRFRVETDNGGLPLTVGSYLIYARADGYELVQAGPTAVAAAEHVDVGEIGLMPPPIVFGAVVPCADLPATGGACRYSVEVRNNSPEIIHGLAWSNIQAAGTGSPLGYSLFPARREQLLRIPAMSSRRLQFSFNVPAGVADGAFFCADAWLSDRETGFPGTLRNEVLFCVSKQQGLYSAMDSKVASARLASRSRSPERRMTSRD